MSEMTKYLIVLVITAFASISWWYLVKNTRKKANSRTFICPNTGHEYYIEEFVKSKDITTGEWYEAILYRDLTQPGIYVRSKEDFFNKFILKETWKV